MSSSYPPICSWARLPVSCTATTADERFDCPLIWCLCQGPVSSGPDVLKHFPRWHNNRLVVFFISRPVHNNYNDLLDRGQQCLPADPAFRIKRICSRRRLVRRSISYIAACQLSCNGQHSWSIDLDRMEGDHLLWQALKNLEHNNYTDLRYAASVVVAEGIQSAATSSGRMAVVEEITKLVGNRQSAIQSRFSQSAACSPCSRV